MVGSHVAFVAHDPRGSERLRPMNERADKAKPKPSPHRVVDARFVAAGSTTSDLPPGQHFEVAFAGRSNVGKSSLMNSLMERRSLVRTSKTPGATRTVNVFEARLASGDTIALADLPGYGYAQRAKSERKAWGTMLEGYLKDRAELRALRPRSRRARERSARGALARARRIRALLDRVLAG